MIFSLFILGEATKAQVSHGGKPLPLSILRNASEQMYEKMPPFDLEETLRLDSLNESDMRSGFHFAYKFMTDFNRYNSGISFTQPDGTKVWRLGLYSPQALSLNIMFTQYRIPEGGQVFVYNEDQSKILGSFNHLNNSDLNVLPIAPIDGERIIVEYQEPANVDFPGELTVGEVNHGYKSLRKEPNENISSISKIPSLACFDDGTNDYKKWGRSVVLLIIDGTTGCSGALINNTENDGKPYLLTASHCLNNLFRIENPDYVKVASSIVCFYNYDSPFCSPIVRGTEEMTTASAHFRAANEYIDMALLELTETPPIHYQPYYAGWRRDGSGDAPFVNIQHPNFSTKRISLTEDILRDSTFTDPNQTFYPNGHWLVRRWDIGFTAGGSSGSPLFNAKGEIVGALSGGRSYANYPCNDLYYKLGEAWAPQEYKDKPERQLQYWLNPANNAAKTCSGLDPYEASPCFRLSNVHASGRQENATSSYLSGSKTDYLFGKKQADVIEYAEAYHANEEATLYGTYIVTPPAGENYTNMEVEITVYSGTNQPTTLLYRETFRPNYLNRHPYKGSFNEIEKSLNRAQESFISFEKPILVNGNFFVGYRFKKMPQNTDFAAYNLPKGTTSKNTTWVKKGNEWKEANEISSIGFNTSLFIDPVLKYQSSVSNEAIEMATPILFQQGARKGLIHLSLPTNQRKATYSLYTAQGKLEENGKVNDPETTLDFGKYKSRVYFLTVGFDNKQYTQKIIF